MLLTLRKGASPPLPPPLAHVCEAYTPIFFKLSNRNDNAKKGRKDGGGDLVNKVFKWIQKRKKEEEERKRKSEKDDHDEGDSSGNSSNRKGSKKKKKKKPGDVVWQK